MKKTNIVLLIAGLIFTGLSPSVLAQAWQLQPVKLQTRWAKEVSPTNALMEYPRPQMTRLNWTNLNGLWDYAITMKDAPIPSQFDGQILVPYSIESALSGIKKSLRPDQNLWYKRTFRRNDLKAGDRLLLHFGAVDWQTTVFVNNEEAGGHTGGYTAFTIDITDYLKPNENELVIKIFDPTDEGIGPHGKQVLNPGNIYYTSTSGIWQTVWLEEVPREYIENLVMTPDIDAGKLKIAINTADSSGLTYEAIASKNDKQIAVWHSNHNSGEIDIPDAHLWSPADPFLYDLTVKIKKHGEVIDVVKSYFGMRKISLQKDGKGIDRIFLNNKYCYNLGVLDQGFWPEGCYTAPTDEALAFDIKAIKAMGFNTIRKHIKVEPARWYYWADHLGMLVWQDMVNPNQGLPEGSKPAFELQCKETLEQLHNYPCITTWVLFNERWGQYDQERLTEWIKQMDPSRIVNGHTGELLYVNGQLRAPSDEPYVSSDMTDVHSYPDPMLPLKQAGKAQVVGEFGGIGVAVPNHEWSELKGWGYVQTTPAQFTGKYHILVDNLKLLEAQGLSGSIYTQPFDVEGEENGLLTYDREIIKIPFEDLRRINSLLVPNPGAIPIISAINSDKSDEGEKYATLFQQYINGNKQQDFLKNLSLMAIRVNDKTGGSLVANSYIETLKAPYSDEQLKFISQFTKSTTDPGFTIINNNQEQLKKIIGDRQLTVNLMNMIFAGIINPQLSDRTDWEKIKASVQQYGAPGDEIYLRARTVDDLNKQNWTDYISIAKSYLDKYGNNLNPQEKSNFQNQLNQHR